MIGIQFHGTIMAGDRVLGRDVYIDITVIPPGRDAYEGREPPESGYRWIAEHAPGRWFGSMVIHGCCRRALMTTAPLKIIPPAGRHGHIYVTVAKDDGYATFVGSGQPPLCGLRAEGGAG